MQTLYTILLALFCAIMGYAIGLHRGFKTWEISKNGYDEGWIAASDYYTQHYELTPIDDMLDELYDDHIGFKAEIERNKKAKEMVEQLDELFDYEEDDDEIIDGGIY